MEKGNRVCLIKEKRNRVMRGLALGLAAVLLSGCAKAPDEESSISGSYQLDGNHIYAEVAENLVVDAQIEGTDKEQCAVLHCTLDNTHTVEEAIEALSFLPEQCEIIEEEFIKGEFYVYPNEDGASMNYAETANVIAFNAGGAASYYTLFSCYDSVYNPEEWMKGSVGQYEYVESMEGLANEELEGFSKEQALEEVKELFDALGLVAEEEPYVFYALTAEELEQMQEAYKEEFPDLDIPMEDCYYMLWNMELEGVPLVSGNYPIGVRYFEGRGEMERGSTVMVVITQEGVQYVQTTGVQYQITGREEEETLLSLEEVLEALPAYYESTLLTKVHTVEQMSFRYVPVLTSIDNVNEPDAELEAEYDMVPAWCMVTSYEVEGKSELHWEVIYMNAITGEFIR